MNVSDCYYLGYVAKVTGFKGEVTIILDVDTPSDYRNMESVFLLINKKLVPFFVKKIDFKPNSRNAVIHFEGVDTEQGANALRGKELYLPLAMLPELDGDRFYYHEIVGYEVIDKNAGAIGVVEQVLDLPGNPVLQVNHNHKEILIPLNDEYYRGLDRKTRRIFFQTPDGLIGLYLGNSDSDR